MVGVLLLVGYVQADVLQRHGAIGMLVQAGPVFLDLDLGRGHFDDLAYSKATTLLPQLLRRVLNQYYGSSIKSIQEALAGPGTPTMCCSGIHRRRR